MQRRCHNRNALRIWRIWGQICYDIAAHLKLDKWLQHRNLNQTYGDVGDKGDKEDEGDEEDEGVGLTWGRAFNYKQDITVLMMLTMRWGYLHL